MTFKCSTGALGPFPLLVVTLLRTLLLLPPTLAALLWFASTTALAQESPSRDAPTTAEEPADGAPSREVQPPLALSEATAEYPPAALEQRVEGRVALRLTVDAQGNVIEAEVLEPAGHGFDEAARAAAMRVRYRPAYRGETPVASRILSHVNFRLPPLAVVEAPHVAAVAPAESEWRRHAAKRPAAVEVTVLGKSQAQRTRESSQAVKVIDTTEARQHATDVAELLARTEGVGVQRSGGLGSEERVSLHGLTDEQVRFFMDGVPLKFSGFGLGIASVPINWLERIEVHRGVVPVRLGTDALGGAIELITLENISGTGVTASYTAGPFDTHQVAAGGHTLHEPSGLFARVAGFVNSTRNDYVVQVRVPDESGSLRDARVRRFHDGYRAGGGSLEAGLVNRPWARRLLLRVFFSAFDKELQHNNNMTVPYGGVTYGESTLGGTVRYELPRIRKSPLGIFVIAGYSRRQLDFDDTSSSVYDWFGSRILERRDGAGELSPFASDLTQWEHHLLGRGALAYRITPHHVLRLWLAPDFVTRSGRERLRVNPDRIDPLTTRREISTLVSGLEYALRDPGDIVENSAFIKQYLYRPATDQVQTFDNSIRHIETSTLRFGAGDAFRVRVLDWLMMKASYEYATRLPQPDEVFGDGSLTYPNLELAPESAHNGNLGLLLEKRLGERLGTLSLEPSLFLRRTENMIIKLSSQDRRHWVHQNVFSVHAIGIDGNLSWTSTRRLLKLAANTTWQDQRNASDEGRFARFSGERVPNRPWLFSNASAEVRIPGIAARNDELAISWVTRYTHEFLPGWADTTAPDDTNRIPSQLTHAAGVVYRVNGPSHASFALDVSNVTDARVFDVLGVQKPGRAVYGKIALGWERPDPERPSPPVAAESP